jgi:hypothetical protein
MPAARTLAVVFLASSPALLGAQRFTCEEASKILLSASAPRPDRFSAANKMFECGNIAAATVAGALRRAKPNSTADTIATILATTTFDRRLADSIRAMALDSRQSTARRTLCLQLLTSYALPFTGVDTEAISRGASSVLHRRLRVYDIWQLLFDPPMPPFATRLIRVEDRTRIVTTIAEMGRQDPDEALRRLAAEVAIELPRLIQESDDNDLVRRRWP